ncbi:MAG: ATP-binding cassette domain-containing protein [Coriobacteriaceae bacterium]|nr:ATP-binding cassette domain-containing protein [Coriobacteriaceae bacterium]
MFLEVRNLSKTIKGVTVLDNINLGFDLGRIYGLRGKNGSGKTMLLKAIAGLIRPTSGEVAVNGKVLGKDISFPPSIGILIENPSFIGKYTGYKNLKLLADIQGRIGDTQINAALEAVGLEQANKKPYRKYSLGMKQRLGVACAVMEDPDIILLDEPTNALDPEGTEKVVALINEHQERGALILVACHDAEELESLTDEIFLMAEGRLVKDERYGRKS